MPEKREVDKTIWGIAIPCILENILTFAAGLIIAAMIGRFSGDEISAQSIGNRITGFMQALFKGLGVGATVVISLSYGSGRLARCRKITEQMMLIAIFISLLLTVIVLYDSRSFLKIFSDNEILIEMSASYIRIVIWIVPSTAVSRIITAAFNAQGNTRTPMIIAIIMNFINVVLGYLLIYVMDLGIMGAAYSLSISYFIGMVIGLFTLYCKYGLYVNVSKEEFLLQWNFQKIKEIFATGFPAAVENMMWSVVAVIVSRALLSYTTNAYAGYQLASQVEEFFAAPCFGFQIAATTLIAQSLGRKDYKMATLYYKRIRFWSVIISIPITLILMIFPKIVMMLLTDKPGIQQVGMSYLMIVAIIYIPQMINMVDFGAIRAAGYNKFPMIVTLIGMWGVRVPMVFLASWILNTDMSMIFIGIGLDMIVRWCIGVVYLKQRKIFI